MSKLPNYIQDSNPFQLAGPPDHFLRGLWEFDPSLVVVPSRQGFYYRLAQRRRPNLTTSIVNEALFKESDTKMLASYNLIPVTTILATVNWGNPLFFEQLRLRAPWRLGGTDKVVSQIEAQEAQKEMDKRNMTDEHLTYLSKDAWRLYNKKIGVRSHMYIPKTGKESQDSSSPRIAANKQAPGIKVGSIFLP